MKSILSLLALILLAPLDSVWAQACTLQEPLDYQVFQRADRDSGEVRVLGSLAPSDAADAVIETRLIAKDKADEWRKLPAHFEGATFTGSVPAPAGGWFRFEVRALRHGEAIGEATVDHVGIGEVFVVAGQSNSANHGEEKQTTISRRVSTFDGNTWRIADDPQAGASGRGGSFLPPFADKIAERFNVPVGLMACGIGATSVREWLPKGATFPNPPTLLGRVEELPNGQWASKGAAFEMLVARMKSAGLNGFRAVLWHQGESDANQKDPSRTLEGKLYREYLETLIRESRRAIGWEAPWFVAQASYHVPGDEGSPEIREAQAAVWKDGLALPGPDSDALSGPLRERGGQGVHFSGEGLRVHGEKWAEKVSPWMERQLTARNTAVTVPGVDLGETLALPECHSTGWVNAWVRANPQGIGSGWDGVLDEAKWGKPSPKQVVERNWDWKITDDQWREAVKQKGEGQREDVKFDLWLPESVDVIKSIVIMSGHGSGENLFFRPDMRALARDLHLALFKFVGNPMQRGFWPRSLLYERLTAFAVRSGHAEIEYAPLFLYGHSNGTGFSAIFPATEGARVWGWVSMRPGITFQVYQPGAAQVPGLVIFGEDDQFFARPSREENLAVVPAMRKNHNALWNIAVEPKTGHGPGDKTWPLVFSFLRHTFQARVPANADARKGPVALNTLSPETGDLGENWDPAKGGYQTLPIAPYAEFTGTKSTASWLVDAAYAADWQAFQRDGTIGKPTTNQ